MTLRFDGEENTISCHVVCDRCGKEQAMTLTVVSSDMPRVFDDATRDESSIHVRSDVKGLAGLGWRTMLRPDARDRFVKLGPAYMDWLVCPECRDICQKEARRRYKQELKC